MRCSFAACCGQRCRQPWPPTCAGGGGVGRHPSLPLAPLFILPACVPAGTHHLRMSVLRDNLDIAVAAQVIISGAIFRIERLPAEVVGPRVNLQQLTLSQRAERQVYVRATEQLEEARAVRAPAIDALFPAAAQMLGEAPGGARSRLWGGAGQPGQPMHAARRRAPAARVPSCIHDPGKQIDCCAQE